MESKRIRLVPHGGDDLVLVLDEELLRLLDAKKDDFFSVTVVDGRIVIQRDSEE